jgi:NAD(P)H-quinone oxidoreductase subunit 5
MLSRMDMKLGMLLLAVPCAPLVAGLVARSRSEAGAIRWTLLAAWVALGLSVGMLVLTFLKGPQTFQLMPSGSEPISFRMDGVAATMSLLVSFLGLTVIRFSRRYLAGDPGAPRFHGWMSLTLGAVLTLVLSANLLLVWIAWVAMSLFLHRLLLHFPERTGAIFSARKKFVVSRLGDAFLLAAVVLVHRQFGTWELERMFAQVAAGNTDGLPMVGALVVACACLKSAQFPFHSWLPDTMETPTPVSAFMHAGIINAGGFLIVRLSPLLIHAPDALRALVVVGSVTAAFAAVVMLAQPTVKRALAFSTIAQMGFMMLECGLGAFGLALVHIVAHSLYKAHAFLHAGSTVGTSARTAIPLRTGGLVFGVVSAVLLVGGGIWLAREVHSDADPGLLGVPLAGALAYGLARLWSGAGPQSTLQRGLPAALGLTVLAFGLHALSTEICPVMTHGSADGLLAGFVVAVFAVLFVFQVFLWRFRTLPFGRALYVHALNGFYVGTYANRLLSRLWPKPESH